MGLAPYGDPVYRDVIVEKLMDLKDDGSFKLDMKYFAYCYKDVMTSSDMDQLFDGPPRKPESEITQREMDIAASIQAVTEEVVLRIVHHAHKLTGMNNLVLAGGVALNCVANGRILREGPFENVWIQPAAGDAGGALGAALFAWHQLLEMPREASDTDRQRGSLLGPDYSDEEVIRELDSAGAVYTHFDRETELCERIARLMADENVVGHFAGPMEFGPRALGARSIIGDARSPKMQSVMNLKIKFRESFRPFAPAVLRERAHEYFHLDPDKESPYMLIVAPVNEGKRKANGANGLKGLDRLKQERSDIPAVTHVDYSARVQTVDEVRNPRFYNIIKAFESQTGCPVVINTSFNVRGEPIVCTPSDAYRCFMGTDMDVLVVGNCLMLKEEQPNRQVINRDEYLQQFALD
jgi:carbamoyltransferase